MRKMESIALQLTDASVCIGTHTLVDSATLQIHHRERVALIGRNGAGKSTLLKLFAGSMPASSGDVRVLDYTQPALLPKRKLRELQAQVGQVFQGLHLVQRLTVLENVLLGSLARNRSWLTWARIFPPAETERAHETLHAVGLHHKAHERTDRLSGGERQKTAIARMLMQSPRVILADEPTAALDPVAAADIAALLASIAYTQNITLVSVVHDPALLPVLAERVIGIRAGRILFDLPVADVDHAALDALYREADTMSSAPDLRTTSVAPHDAGGNVQRGAKIFQFSHRSRRGKRP